MEFLNKYGAAILTAVAALVAIILLCVVFAGLKDLVPLGNAALPLVAIGGVVVLVLLLTAVATMFSILGLTDAKQALGLPEGSIRAVIALSLIVLFAILSIFLYQQASSGGPLVTIAQMSGAERSQFIKDHVNARDIQSVPVPGKTDLFDVSYRSANPAGEDFAKQLLVLLGTLMTAVTSFYLGAGTVTSAVNKQKEASGEGATNAVAKVTGTKPGAHSIKTDGPTLHLALTGTNLSGITDVKLTKTGEQPMTGTGLKHGDTEITCDVDVAKASPGTWTIEAAEGSAPARKAGMVTLSA